MLTVWVVIFKKPNLRVCLLVEVSFLYYNYCPIRLIFAILFCVFSLSCLFSCIFFFYFLLSNGKFFNRMSYILSQPPVLGNSWLVFFQPFSPICFRFCILLRLPMLLPIGSKSCISFWRVPWVGFLRDDIDFGGLSFIVLVFLICLIFFSGLIFNSRIITCFESRKLWWTGVGEGK